MSVDLDALEAFYSSIDFDRSPQVVAVIVELRAAREVVKASQRWHDKPLPDGDPCHTCRALAAYDKAVAS